MILIPAIDIMDGKVVRLIQGEYDKKTIYDENPVEFSKSLEESGIEYLHFVDLDGARRGKPVNLKILERICSVTSLKVDYGGGIRDKNRIIDAFRAGAIKVNLGTILLSEPELIPHLISQFGSEKLIAALDVAGSLLKSHGWQRETDLSLDEVVKNLNSQGYKYFTVTQISRDGMLNGPDISLYKHLLEKFPNIKLTASGGVSGMNDISDLKKTGLYAAIIGKAMFTGKITLKDLNDFLNIKQD